MFPVWPMLERSHVKDSVDLRFPVQWCRQTRKDVLGSQRGVLTLSGGVRKTSPELAALGYLLGLGYQCPGKATALVKDDFHRNGQMRRN